MARYRIEEEDDDSGFLIFIQLVLCIIFLPIGIIVLAVKAYNYFSEKSRVKEIQQSEIKANKHLELQSLASLRDQNIITEEEFQERKQRIMRKL